MGSGKAGFSINRAEFTHDNALDGDIEYQRGGGCFVTTKKAIVLVIIAIFALAAVSTFIYFYGTKRSKSEVEISSDIEKLLNDSLYDLDTEDIRLPSQIQPIHYRLRIYPRLDEPSSDNFTFTGQVTILIHCTKPTKKIVLHSEDLHILENEVTVAMIKNSNLISMSQILPDTGQIGNISENNTPNQQAGLDNVARTQPGQQQFVPAENIPPVSPEVPNVLGLSTTPDPLSDPLSTSSPKSVPFSQPLPSDSNATYAETKPSVPNEVNQNATFNKSQQEVNPPVKKVELVTVLPPTNSIREIPETVHLNIKRHEEIKEMSRYVIHLVNALEVGVNYTIDIKFSGKILNNLVGLYRTSYADNEGRKRWLLTTHFQPIYARRVFPCFDEPSIKSVFEISIARQSHMIALSNMPIKESEPMANNSGWMWDHFQNTPPMSTYLIAFTVSDFENVATPLGSDTDPILKIWTPKNSINGAQYAKEIAPKIFTYLQNYFGIKYPLPKIDLINIPELSQTALENWGLISFRDTALLLDPQSTNWKAKNHIFKTIAGTFTKQWFGDLVTMEWWSEFWLTEGFSTYMEDVVENTIEPALEDLDTFSLRITQAILDSDKLKSVRSLHSDIKDPTQIEQLFDNSASNKGSCLIRMLNYTLTGSLFQKAIQNYLKTWMYQCSTQNELWKSFTQIAQEKNILSSDLSIQHFMDSWIKQEGFPVVTVNRNYENGNAVISQKRFVHGNDSRPHLWYIPLTYTYEEQNEVISTMWMKKEETITAVNFTSPGSTKWVLFNIDGAGLYRVNYDEKNWNLLQNQLMNNSDKIAPSNRGQLLNDAFELASVGLLNYEIAFGLTQYLSTKERHYIPWFSLFNSFKQLRYVITTTKYNGIFQQYILNTIKPLYDELGSSEKPEEPQNDKLLRNVIIEEACTINYEPCLQWAIQMYQEWMTLPDPDKNNPIPYEFRKTVMCTAIRMGGEKEWNFLWQRTLYPPISSSDLRTIYLSLGCSREPWLINSYLEKSLDGVIALQNVPYVWKSIAQPIGLNVGLIFLRANWKRIFETYQHIFSIFNSIFEDFLSRLSTKADLEYLTIFYKTHKELMHPVSSLMLSVVDRIKWRISWTESYLPTVITWLSKNN